MAEEQSGGACSAELVAHARAILHQFAEAQCDDGYLGTWLQQQPERHYRDLRQFGHELYTMGHMLEACCAYQGARPIPTVSTRIAERLDGSPYGRPSGPDGRAGFCGHPEIELALMRWWQDSGDERARTLAGLMVDRRGANPSLLTDGRPTRRTVARGGLEWRFTNDWFYIQDHQPVREQVTIAEGHAVRALYLYAGMTDLCGRRRHHPDRAPLERLWASATRQHLFITRGMGAITHGERFGTPTTSCPMPRPTARPAPPSPSRAGRAACCSSSSRARTATCSSARSHNTMLAAGSRSTASTTSTATRWQWIPQRSPQRRPACAPGRAIPWFGCACCPPNIARTLSQLAAFAYSDGLDGVAIHLYVSGTAR